MEFSLYHCALCHQYITATYPIIKKNTMKKMVKNSTNDNTKATLVFKMVRTHEYPDNCLSGISTSNMLNKASVVKQKKPNIMQ